MREQVERGMAAHGEVFSLRFPSRLEYVPHVCAFFREALKSSLSDQETSAAVFHELDLILTEAMNNVIIHAHGEDASKPVGIRLCVDEGCVEVEVEDQGGGFELRKPCLPEDPLAESGRGLYIMSRLSQSLSYERGEGKNTLRILKRMIRDEDEGLVEGPIRTR